MTAWEMEHRLFCILYDSWAWSCPNIFMWFWESDIIVISKDDYIVEYEIKVSVSDYKRDSKKRKHHFVKNELGPNRFIYALPAELKDKIKEIPIPEYAGLYLVHQYQIEIVKKPPLIHRKKVNDNQMRRLHRSLHYKAWDAMNNLSMFRIERDMKK